MEYIRVEDGVITEILSSSHNLEKEGCIQLELTTDVVVGERVDAYDNNWLRKSTSELVRNGVIELKKSSGEDGISQGAVIEKLEGERIVPKTYYDLVTEGSRELGYYEVLDHENKEIFEVSEPEELLEHNKISEGEAVEIKSTKVREYRDKLLTQLDRVVANPLRWEDMSDNEKEKIRIYRKFLLEVPDQDGFPWNVKWPTKPENVT